MKTEEVMNSIETLIAATAPKTPVTHPRPYRTFYYASARDKDHEWSRIGRACTRIGALRAAVVKVLKHEAQRADVYGEDGVRVAYLYRKGNKITIVCV